MNFACLGIVSRIRLHGEYAAVRLVEGYHVVHGLPTLYMYMVIHTWQIA